MTEKAEASRLWLERLRLSNFRNYSQLTLDLDARPLVITGANGAGKTNLLEAVSLLAPGRGLRQSAFHLLARSGSETGWAVSGRLRGALGEVELGTGRVGGEEGSGRQTRIDGKTVSGSGRLGEHVRLVWLTPQMDGLFTGPAGDRRRFLDRMVQSLDPGFRAIAGRYERAMRQRNRLFESHMSASAQFEGLEWQMAEAGVAIAAGRRDCLAQLVARITERRDRDPGSPFPWATLALDGSLEQDLARMPAVEVEDGFRLRLGAQRERDRAAKRALEGPHRSDLVVGHGPKGHAAHLGSTGEQKALLTGLILAHAELIKAAIGGWSPIMLLDEIAAHLDADRRQALFAEILALGTQAWLTGTDAELFQILQGDAQFLRVHDGSVET